MHPILFKIPLFGLFGRESFPLHGYGVMVALGFLAGSWYVQRQARRAGQDPGRALDLVFYVLIAAIFGSRILHVLVSERDLFLKNPLHLFRIWEGGLVFYGGLLASLLVSIWYFRHYRLPAFKYADFFAPAVAMGHSLGRLGCFLAGCCYGRPLLERTWYAIVFPPVEGSLAPAGVPLFPTQIAESLAEFLIFLFLHWKLQRKRFDGQIVSMYLMLYSAWRFGIEFFRGDLERGFVAGSWISTSQLISMILFAIGLLLYLYRRGQKEGVAR